MSTVLVAGGSGFVGVHTILQLLAAGHTVLGKIRRATSAKARKVLGWTPRGNDEVILATAERLIRLGLVKP
jgi:dihydroflavonol-4-reductase